MRHFSWQAQYLVKLEWYFSWQAQHVVKFCEIAGARNVEFSKCISKMGLVRSPNQRVRDEDFIRIMLGLSSDYRRIVCTLVEAIQRFSAEVLDSEFRRTCSIW